MAAWPATQHRLSFIARANPRRSWLPGLHQIIRMYSINQLPCMILLRNVMMWQVRAKRVSEVEVELGCNFPPLAHSNWFAYVIDSPYPQIPSFIQFQEDKTRLYIRASLVTCSIAHRHHGRRLHKFVLPLKAFLRNTKSLNHPNG